MKQKFILFFIFSLSLLGASDSYTRHQFLDHSIRHSLAEKRITLIVMRHGEAVHNVEKILTSSLSEQIHLTECGKDQVRKSAEHLKEKVKPDFILVSPLYRTKQTASIVADVFGIEQETLLIADDLREPNVGIMEGKPIEEYFACFKDDKERMLGGVDGGETGLALFDRLHSLLGHIVDNPIFEGKTVLLVTHGWPACQINMCLEGSFNDMPGTADFKVYM